jgi:hypothetical protein
MNGMAHRFLIPFVFLLLLLCPTPANALTVKVSLSGGGCGSTYSVGQQYNIYVSVSEDSYVTIKNVKATGTTILENNKFFPAHTNYGIMGWMDEPNGTHTITAEAKSLTGVVVQDSCSFNVVGGTTIITTPPPSPSTVIVFVKDREGKPVSGANVHLDGTFSGKTDASGILSLSTTSGSHIVTASLGDKKDSRSITVSGSATAELILDIMKAGTIMVSIKDQNGQPVGGAELYLDGTLVLSDVQGTCKVPNVNEGPHALKAVKEKSVDVKDVFVEANKTSSVVLTLDMQMVGTLTVSVVDGKGNPIDGASLYINNEVVGITNPKGVFVKENLPPGIYTILASKSGYKSSVANSTVTPNAQSSVTILLASEINYLLYGGIAGGVLLFLALLILMTRRKPAPPPPVEPFISEKVQYEKKVEDKKAAYPPKPTPATTSNSGRVLYCKLCHGALDKELNPFVCECGQPYHQECAQRHHHCPACGRNMGGVT